MTRIAQLLTALGGTALLGLLGPPDSMTIVYAVAMSCAALAWLLALLAAKRRKTPRLRDIVWAVLVLSLVLPGYLAVRDWATVPYGDDARWRGGTLTEAGNNYQKTHPSATNEELLDAATGENHHVWTAESIAFRKAVTWASFPLSVIALLFPILYLETLIPSSAVSANKP